MCDPKSAESTFEGTQYFSSPGSRNVLTTSTRVPRFFASSRYFSETGWSLATFEPKSTMTSVPYQSA